MLKVAVIGAGRWGKNHVRTAHKLNCLAAVIESDPQKIKELNKNYPDVKIYNALDQESALDYDAYIIAVPAEFHYQLAKTCILAKKHVNTL